MTTDKYTEQKELANDLVAIARNCANINAEPATTKQCWFIAGLMIEADMVEEWKGNMLDSSYMLTKRQASEEIAMLQDLVRIRGSKK